jgi:hypothetical protein
MSNPDLFQETAALAGDLSELTDDLVLIEDSPRLLVSSVSVSLAHEHWSAVRVLLAASLLPSAMVIHRTQFEATMRSVWLAYSASESDVAKLSADLNRETEQSAKNVPAVAMMMRALEGRTPPQAIEMLTRFKDASWNAMTSYAHAGIHALNRHREGYPTLLIENVLRNANGLAVAGFFQLVALCGRQPLQREILARTASYSCCLPDVI